MSSVGSFHAQIPKGGDAFIAYQTSGANMLLEANLPTSASTGYQSALGSSYVFNTVANANTAISASASPIVEGDTFQSLGKKLYFYVNGSVGGVPMIYAVLEKVREVSDLATAGGLYEGGDGNVGYVVTYSAAPGTTPVSVVRTGRTNGGI
jgi:hypothetical protein